ncbi:MAG: hypothetical protein ABJC13_20410 [Acidobacteriota bacterium]
MRVLLDESLPKKLKNELTDHKVAHSNDISDLLPLVPNLLAAILRISPGQVLHVGA